ncbi:MAG: glycosyltransferase family 4 protein [Candidatus Omnitrophota bacterium]
MNILFLSRDYPPNLIGGVGIYVLEMSRLLAKMGHNVYVLTQAVEYPCKYMDSGVTVFRVKPERLRFLGIIRNKLPGTVERLEYSYAVSRKIKEVVRKYGIDIIESSEARAEGFWYFLIGRTPPLLIKLHTPESIALKLDNVYPDLDYRIRFLLEKWWLRRANRVVGLSRAIVELTSRYFNIAFNGIPIVPNPIDADFFSPHPPNSNFNKAPIVLYVGRLELRKGVHVLMRAIPRVLQEIPKAKFIFIGKDSGMRAYLINKVNQLRYQDNVEFIDALPRYRLKDFYQKSTICVIPSLWENHPYSCLEAMACGKAIVATETGGLPEIIQNGVNGVLVEAGSSSRLADNIVGLISNERLRDKLGRNARKTIEERYAPVKVIQQTVSIYEKLLGK